jgi:hypothetical protein
MKATHIILLALMAAHMAEAAIITVTSTADSGPGTLRAALASAANGDTINFSVSGTILLTSGELLVTNSLTILGPGPNNLAVNGNAASRVFHITNTATVSISSLTITNGNLVGGLGGGIFNDHATLTVKNCIYSGNSAGYYGGGIWNEQGALTVSGCTLSGNSAGIGGGGIWNQHATLIVSNCTVSGNSAGGEGGGIFNNGTSGSSATLTMANSTLSGNSANAGGGIYNDGSSSGSANVKIVNSTLSSNSAALYWGGGINNYGFWGSTSVQIVNSTLSGNSANYYGGGIYNYGDYGSASLQIVNSTLNGNWASTGGGIANNGANGNPTLEIGSTILNAGASGGSIALLGGKVTSDGYNLSSDDGGGFLTATGDQINKDPLLSPLQDNGGPTFTHALLPGSPAIDKGKNFSVSATDQRGHPRTYDNPIIPNAVGGDGTDIGAFELLIPPVLAIAPNFGNVILSWSTNNPGYTVESTTVLPNSGSWTTVPGTPLVIGNQYLLGDGPVTGNKFYRLKAP